MDVLKHEKKKLHKVFLFKDIAEIISEVCVILRNQFFNIKKILL